LIAGEPRRHIEQSAGFEKAYRKLSSELQRRVVKTIDKLVANPERPGLHVEKVKLARQTVRTCRVTDDTRIVFEITQSQTLQLLYVGPHRTAYQHAESPLLSQVRSSQTSTLEASQCSVLMHT
jgi:mRNA-degrading endonuclease RelE of RelBE toxin-antitoxin system